MYQALTAIVGALVAEGALAGVTSLFIGADGQYGAPLAVGRSCGFCISSFGAQPITFSVPLFAADVALTAVLFWFLMARGGRALLITIGALVFLVAALVMYNVDLPVAGIPLPAARRAGSFDMLALWIDLMAGAALFAIPGVLRAARSGPDVAKQGP